YALPSLVSAQECCAPEAIEVNVSSADTGEDGQCSTVDEIPNCPLMLYPQHAATLAVVRPHTLSSPDARMRNPGSGAMSSGITTGNDPRTSAPPAFDLAWRPSEKLPGLAVVPMFTVTTPGTWRPSSVEIDEPLAVTPGAAPSVVRLQVAPSFGSSW